jgi:DNA topoisomerase VI B subunit
LEAFRDSEILTSCKQYVAEFIDNSLDAIESFQWSELEKPDSKYKFSLDQETALENLTIVQEVEEPTVELQDQKQIDLELDESGEIVDKEEIEAEEEVKRIINDIDDLLKPVANLVDIEPIVIIRMREYEPPSILTSELSQKNVMSYSFEIFDNGIGMNKGDLRKFGKYLASSKSVELKQTRGSQGFGAPSAFSDAQNTTGKPIIVASKTADIVFATASEFFTTSKNEKRYLIHPTEIDSPFLHGTYIKLNYLNVKYVRGYVDTYIKETALMNPHITIIFLDPYGEVVTYPRLVSSFPREPKYAKPHPTSTNIGDLQDLLTKSENLTVSAFLQENFVRISSRTAKEIISIAERELQEKNNLLILKEGYITKSERKTDDTFYCTYEKRVYGRSEKPRDTLVVYKLASEEINNNYWELISKYSEMNKEISKIEGEIKKYFRRIDTVDTKKEERKIERSVDKLMEEIEKINEEKENLKVQLSNLLDKNRNQLEEQKKSKNRTDYEDLINQTLISRAKPSELTSDQFNSLFQAFKSVKYMAPPTDTAIPVGDTVLENTLIKEVGLKISDNLEDIDEPISEIISMEKAINREASITGEEKPDLKIFNSKILASYDILIKPDQEEFQQIYRDIIHLDYQKYSPNNYHNVFEFFSEYYAKDDDFVSAETRPPTSGKGLAYIVEAALAYCNDPKKLDTPKRSRDVLSRFVNRTPKLRDSADCAITKAVQSVNWKNYKLETFDNNLPKGPIKLLVNVSGPYVHLMFKSQSKNALADDEELIKEIKYCLEAIGRRLRAYLNKKATIRKSEKRASVIEKYVPEFIQSLYNIVATGDSELKQKISVDEMEELMIAAVAKRVKPPVPKIIEEKPIIEDTEVKKAMKEEIEPQKPTEIIEKEEFSEKALQKWTKNELIEYCEDRAINISKSENKTDLIKKILESYSKEAVIEKPTKDIEEKMVEVISKRSVEQELSRVPMEQPKPKPKVPKMVQTSLPVITSDRILSVLTNDWQNITHLIFKLKIKDMMDARYLQNRLKDLVRKKKVEMSVIKSKKHWRKLG